jgi:quercetin dioxygenase-like cupin family protein
MIHTEKVSIVENLPEVEIDLDHILTSPYFYEQGLMVKVVEGGRSENVNAPCDVFGDPHHTIKIEGMERYSEQMVQFIDWVRSETGHSGPITVHLFFARTGSISFPLHVDKETVLVYVIDGTKRMRVSTDTDSVFTINKGEALVIPAGVKHEAINSDGSLMLSVGLEPWLKERSL